MQNTNNEIINNNIKGQEKENKGHTSINESNNNGNNMNNEETNVENLLKLIKDQTTELKKNKKRLEKLEEKFIKTSADLKNVLADKQTIENFLRIIFPREMHENIVKTDYGMYDSAELSKFWIVSESKNQNEFQKILNQLKNENSDFSEKNKNFSIDLDIKAKEIKKLKSQLEEIKLTNEENSSKFNEVNSKYEIIESEKLFLMSLVDEKNQEIEKLKGLEIENAELKAKSLLENITHMNNSSLNYKGRNDDIKNNNFKKYGKNQNNSINMIKILTLNSGNQTTEEVFSANYVQNLENQLREIKEKYEKLKREFNEHKERSHKILLENEETSQKISKENEELKQKVTEINQEIIKIQNLNINKSHHLQNKTESFNSLNLNTEIAKKQNTTTKSNLKKDNYDDLNPEFNISEINNHRVSIEYLKNVILKYLEAITIGNEFQTKILENVIFSILKISNVDRVKLEEKRNRSSFYLNLWYNAKAFLSAKIYGSSIENETNENENNSDSVNFGLNQEFLNALEINHIKEENKESQEKENLREINDKSGNKIRKEIKAQDEDEDLKIEI